MTKERFLVLVDYQHAGYGFIVLANSRKDVEETLHVERPDCGITVIDRDIDSHPLVKYMGDSMEVHELEKPAGLLKATLVDVDK